MRIVNAPAANAGDFASILETLDHAPELGDGAAPVVAGPGGHVRPDTASQDKDWLLQLIGSISAQPSAGGKTRPTAGYADEIPEPPAPRAMLPDDLESVAAELGLRQDMSEEELRHVRRAFALANHPDRLLPDERARATRRMTLANMLIDQKLKLKAAAH